MSKKVYLDFVHSSVIEIKNTIVANIEGAFSERFKNVIIVSLKEALLQKQKEWVEKVKERLNDVIPKHMLHKKRYPRNREFPYLNSGELRDSTFTFLHQQLGDKSVTFNLWYKFLSKHAFFTTNAIKSDDAPGWKGWTDRVFEKGGNNFISAKQMVHSLFEKDKLQMLIRKSL